MGTDIHLRVEYRAPRETVVLRDGEIQVAPVGDPAWTPAEKLTRKEDIPLNRFYLENLDDPEIAREWEKMPSWELARKDRFYTARDYAVFGALAGVRGSLNEQWEPRGIPEDASLEVLEEMKSWGFDGHTHSWQRLDELLAVDWKDLLGYVESPWQDLLTRLEALAIEKCNGDRTAVRIVYLFDN